MSRALKSCVEGASFHYLKTPSIPSIHGAFMCDEVEKRGFDGRLIANVAGRSKDELLLPGGLIAPNTFFDMVLSAMDICGTGDFGISFGLSVETLPFRDALASGLSIRAALCAPNLHRAIERLTYFSSLESRIFVNKTQMIDNSCRIQVVAPWIQENLVPELQRFYIDTYFSYFHQKIIAFLGEEPKDVELRFTHSHPRSDDSYDMFGGKIHFGSDENSYSITKDQMSAPNVKYNRSTSALVVRQCEDALEARQRSIQKTWKSKVLGIISAETSYCYPTLAEVSKALNIGERTLARNLKQEKSGYQSIVDQHRFHIAKELLRDTPNKVEAIAQELGFSDASNFRRAFKKWAGRPPLEYRQLFQ